MGALTLMVLLAARGGSLPAQAPAILVTSTSQNGGGCTLTDAMHAVQTEQPFGGCPSGAGISTIRVPAGEYVLEAPAVDEYGERTGLPIVTQPLTIEGDGPGATVIRRAAPAPPFRLLKTSAPLVLRGLTLAGGDATGHDGGAVFVDNSRYIPGPFGHPRLLVDVQDVRFEGNRAQHGGALGELGFVHGPGVEFRLRDAVFSGNAATHGGGAVVASPGSLIDAARVRFEDNVAGEWGGAIHARHQGVGIDVSDSVFERNRATGQTGGAIHAWDVRIARTTLRANTAGLRGGALYSHTGRPIVSDSTFEGNTARRGGAIEVLGGSLEVSGTTFAENQATEADGSAIRVDERPGTSRIVNATFSGNRAQAGGAIALGDDWGGALTILSSTIAFNTNLAGGWSAGITVDNVGRLRLANTIVAGNTTDGAGLDLYFSGGPGARLASLGHNLIGVDLHIGRDFLQVGDRLGTAAHPLDPGLLPLADNGGPTWTHALTATSLARDAGSPAPPGPDEACPAVDQRGLERPGPGASACDIGAFEAGVAPDVEAPTAVIDGPAEIRFGETLTMSGARSSDIGGSGIAMYVWQLDARPPVEIAPPTATIDFEASLLGSGLHIVTLVVLDGAGNASAVATAVVTVRAPLIPTMVSLTSSASPAPTGEAVTLTAQVVPVGATGMPTGGVTFVHSPTGQTLGSGVLDQAGAASVTTSLPEGTFEIAATYAGDVNYAGSSGTMTQVVAPLPNAAIRNGDPEESALLAGVGMLLAPSGARCTGTLIGPHVVLTAAQCVRDWTSGAEFTFTIGAGRTATVKDVRIHPGFDEGFGLGHNLAFDVALVALDPDVTRGWTEVLPLALYEGAIAIGANAVASGFGETPWSRPEAARTSGAVRVNGFLGGEGPIGVPLPDAFIETVPASSRDQMFCPAGVGGPLILDRRIAGVASFRYVATCAEPGPGYYLTASRLVGWVNETVADLEARSTTLELSSSANPSKFGQPLTLRALVSASSPGAELPKGDVRFLDVARGLVLGIVALDASGGAELPVGGLDIGAVEFRADYTGFTGYRPSTGSLVQQVERGEANVALTSHPSPSTIGQPVMFTAVVTAQAPATGMPRGVVRFEDRTDGTLLGRAPIDDAGAARVTVASLPVGDRAIQATYEGSPHFAHASREYVHTVHPRRVPVTLTWNGGGTLTDEQGVALCVPDGTGSCTLEVAEGAALHVTAQPAAQASFMAWGGACASQSGAVCSIVVTAAANISATFGYPVTVAREGPVFVSAPPVLCSTYPCTLTLPAGPTLLRATPANLGTVSWAPSGVCAQSSGLECRFTLDRPVSLTVTFDPDSGSASRRPVARISGPTRVTARGDLTPVLFDGSASSDPLGRSLRFSWSVEGQSGQASSFIPQLPIGFYVVTLTVTNPDGRTDTATHPFRVEAGGEVRIEMPNRVLEVTNGLSVPLAATGVMATHDVLGPLRVKCYTGGFFGSLAWRQEVTTLSVGRHRVTCEARGPDSRLTTAVFEVTVRPSAAQVDGASALREATFQTPGATRPMRNAANAIRLWLQQGRAPFVCSAVGDFKRSVTAAGARRAIAEADALALLARGEAFATLTACRW